MKRFKHIALCSLFILVLSLSAACAEPQEEQAPEQEPESLLISAAASLKDALTEILQLYNKENPDAEIDITFGSSGSLATQIAEGAEVDIFISAAMKQMNDLQDKDLVVNDSMTNLLGNKLVLIVPKDSDLSIESFSDITKDELKKIAVGEPLSVPAGQYAEEVFTNLNILDEAKAKTVISKDVSETLTWVESGNADAGIVYHTDALNSNKVKIVAEAVEGTHSPIVYPAAIIKNGKNSATAEKFMEFLKSDQSKGVFEKYGFTFLNE